MMRADLHTHTFLSDGILSPEDVVRYAKRIGLDYIAITDHDTLAGVVPACTYGRKIGISVIAGVEISSRDYKTGDSVHMLCYYPKNVLKLQAYLDQILINRETVKRKMAQKLMKDYPVTIEHIEKYSKNSQSIYEVHLMQPLADLGYTDVIIGQLYKELVSKKGRYYEEIAYPSVYEVLEVIKQVGGIAVMAHPGQFDSMALLEELAYKGLIQGVEYNHPRNSEEVKMQIESIAQNYNLIMTGGTDFHGYYTSKPQPLGSYRCHKVELEKLIDLGK